jgi:hypothetical protein
VTARDSIVFPLTFFEIVEVADPKLAANRRICVENYVNLDFCTPSVFPLPWIGISPSQIREEIEELEI